MFFCQMSQILNNNNKKKDMNKQKLNSKSSQVKSKLTTLSLSHVSGAQT